MMDVIDTIAPWSAVAWPLIVAVMPGPFTDRARLVAALVPAAFLPLLPNAGFASFPWLMFGAQLGLAPGSGWLVGMWLVVWSAFALRFRAGTGSSMSGAGYRLPLLVMAGSLGVILARDLATYFVFCSITGYGFYGLLVQAREKALGARVYLWSIVIADACLFEVLLLAGNLEASLAFDAVKAAVPSSDAAVIYTALVLAGFGLRGAAFPVHGWLPAVAARANGQVMALLAGVPVAIALIGLIRWLPLGADNSPVAAVAQALGAIGVLYGVSRAAMATHAGLRLGWAIVSAASALVFAAGYGLANPGLWAEYGIWARPAVAAIGVAPIAMTWRIGEPSGTTKEPRLTLLVDTLLARIRLMASSLEGRVDRVGSEISRLAASVLSHGTVLAQGEHNLGRWPVAISLLAIVVVLLGAFSMSPAF